jgi:hypothetical protein
MSLSTSRHEVRYDSCLVLTRCIWYYRFVLLYIRVFMEFLRTFHLFVRLFAPSTIDCGDPIPQTLLDVRTSKTFSKRIRSRNQRHLFSISGGH